MAGPLHSSSSPSSRILLVEDRDSLRKMMHRALSQAGFEVTACADGEEGIRQLREEPFDLVLTDLKLPGTSGLEVLAASRSLRPQAPVVVLTAYGTVTHAVEAMKLGAFDFLEKPVDLDDLLRLARRAIGEEGRDEAFAPPGCPPIVGRHPRLRAVLQLLQKVAPTDSTVLLTGESGTGKELFARALHALSPRGRGPFVAVNCAAIPEALMENELFGHEKGAFTGANRLQPGRFEQAARGTLFLDEIGELDVGVQAKVLRVLDEQGFERVGGSRTLKADVRIVAATNRDLRKRVDEGDFRADLYFRLDVFPIELPPLRQRASDIPLLARHLAAQLAERHGRPAPYLSEEATELLSTHSWPGNVRELANVLERAVILAESSRLETEALRSLIHFTGVEKEVSDGGDERNRLRKALLAASGDKHKAAEELGISYRTLQRRLKTFDLEGFPRYRA